MKIGIYFTPQKNSGGVYQYSLTFLECLQKISGHKYTIFAVSKDIPSHIRESKNFTIVNTPKRNHGFMPKAVSGFSYLLTYFLTCLKMFSLMLFISRLFQRENISMVERKDLDLMFYPTSSNLSFLARTPSVVAVHDLMHRAYPEFPEVSAGGRWESREYVYQNISKHAYRILVDSKVGKNDVRKYYKTDPKKIVVLPFLAPSYLNGKMPPETARKICKSLKLPDKFIFYPAKFWPHKNHTNLIKALNILKQRGLEINLVLTGSKDADFSSFGKVFSLIRKHCLEKQIFYLGYINREEISAIYKVATAMVMPTYLGPTNIPILEAWTMGTPIVYSNIRGCREQLGDAGLLINPYNPKDIADKIGKLYTQPRLALKLAKKGRIRVNSWTFKDFSLKVKQIIDIYEKERNLASKGNKK